MKKFLIATTALALSAGFASADVKLSGDARFGIQHDGARTKGIPKAARTMTATYLEKRMTVNIDGSTTADNGVTFGARVRIRSDENAGTAVAGARVYARAGGLTVAAGNILGAIESMPNTYSSSVGLTGLGWSGLVVNVDRGGLAGHGADYFDWDAYSSRGNGAEGVEVIYSMGDFTGHVSYSSNSLRGLAGPTKRLAAYGAYKFSDWTFLLGFQDSNRANNVEDKIILGAMGKIGDFGLGFQVAQNGKGAKGVGGKITKYVVNGSYTMGATTVSGYIANQNVLPVGPGGAALASASKSSYGLGVSYDMGGGAKILGGVERTTRKDTRADLGVSFSF